MVSVKQSPDRFELMIVLIEVQKIRARRGVQG